MSSMKSSQAPALLPLGAVVGSWRVVAWGGSGIYGVIYRAVRVEAESELAGSVALKVAQLPGDPRFAREAELLSRLRHPSIPRLWHHGEWQHPSGAIHPYIVMDFVDGIPLYEWAQRHTPSSQQVARLLAQLAGALKAVHAQGALHRGVKGANILVRRTDGRAILTDFGSGLPLDSPRLTPQSLIPGTPAYRAPEAALFPLRFGRDPTARYSAGPADDLYALGVTAYRLVTGHYPEFGEPFKDRTGMWQPGALGSPPANVLNPRVSPHLATLIMRMLAVLPEERGTAAQLTEALEQVARSTAPENTRPIFDQEAVPPSEGPTKVQVEKQASEESSLQHSPRKLATPHAPVWPWRQVLAMAAACVTLVAAAWWAAALGKRVEMPSLAQKESSGVGQPDGGTTGLGDAASTASVEDSPEPSLQEMMAKESLPEPMPGQAQPDAKGRCPRKRQVALNGACWGELKLGREACEDLNGQLLQDKCYVPIFPTGRQPTSSPPRKP